METYSVNRMLAILKENPDRLELVKKNPLLELQRLRDEVVKEIPAYFGDKWLYRVAVIVLGSLAIIAAVSSVILVLEGKTTPEVLVALGSAAVGALVGLFAPSPVRQ